MTLYTSSDDITGFLASAPLAILYFSSDDCNICKALKPKIEELATEYPMVSIGEVNLTKTIEPSAKYNVFVVPAVVVFTEGKEAQRMARAISISELETTLKRYCELLN